MCAVRTFVRLPFIQRKRYKYAYARGTRNEPVNFPLFFPATRHSFVATRGAFIYLRNTPRDSIWYMHTRTASCLSVCLSILFAILSPMQFFPFFFFFKIIFILYATVIMEYLLESAASSLLRFSSDIYYVRVIKWKSFAEKIGECTMKNRDGVISEKTGRLNLLDASFEISKKIEHLFQRYSLNSRLNVTSSARAFHVEIDLSIFLPWSYPPSGTLTHPRNANGSFSFYGLRAR